MPPNKHVDVAAFTKQCTEQDDGRASRCHAFPVNSPDPASLTRREI